MELMKLNLYPGYFSDCEKTIIESGRLIATTFTYKSGVCGLRIRNSAGELVILPFQGQQICSIRISMKAGYLDLDRAAEMESVITGINSDPNP